MLAPTDAAFNKMKPGGKLARLENNKPKLKAFLLGHVIAGAVKAEQFKAEGSLIETQSSDPLAKQLLVQRNDRNELMIREAKVTQADAMATNGVLHVVDKVLGPLEQNIMERLERAWPDAKTTTLENVIWREKLADMLTGPGPVTFFAPTDAAIYALGDKAPSGEALKQTLEFHVVPGAFYSFDLSNGQSLETLLKDRKQTVSVDSASKAIKFGSGKVILRNVQASNGVIHLVDTVQLATP